MYGIPRWISYCALVVLLVLSYIYNTQIPHNAHAQQPGEVLVYSQDFESSAPVDWHFEDGWRIAESDGGHALAGSGHVWAFWNSNPYVNYRYTFRLKLESNAALHTNTRINQVGRYFIGLNRGGTYLSKQFFPEQFFDNLARGAGISADWHNVEVIAQEAVISMLVDGKPWLSYTDPDPLLQGGVAFESLDQGVVWIDDLQVYVAANEISTQQWVRTGGPLGGLGYDVRMHPGNPDIMYVTDAKAGVFKSTDGGATWFPANQGITARTGETGELIPVFCLTIDPNNPDIIWVGTQFQRGVFKSVDAGDTWQKMDSGITERDLTMRGFGVDPNDSNVVYAAAEVSSWEWSGQPIQGREFDLTRGVVYKTIDGGNHWVKVWEGDNLARYIWIDPRDSDVIYVSTGIFDREAANSDPQKGTPGGVGVIKSQDGGKTWQPANNGLKNLYIGSLYMHPQNPDILLAAAGNVQYNEGNGVYLSTDGGASWQHTLKNDMIQAVEFSENNPLVAYAGGYSSIYMSQDGGLTWKVAAGGNNQQQGWGSPGIMAGHPIDFQVDPRDPQRFFSNQYGGGNFVTPDGGVSWQPASKGYTGAMIRDLVVDPTAAGRVIAASRSGIFISHNGGDDWQGISWRPFYFLDWHAVALDPSDPQHLLSELTCNGVLVQSRDGGQSWTEVANIPNGVRAGFGAITFAPSNSSYVYAGSTGFYSCGGFSSDMPAVGVYYSRNGGDTWQRSNDPAVQDLSVSNLAVHPQKPDFVYAASFQRGAYHSQDGGVTWQQVGGGLPVDRSITAISYHPQDGNILMAGVDRDSIYRSLDGGQFWLPVSIGMPPEAVIRDIVFDPQNPQVVYAADINSGVYRSEDSGERWIGLNNHLELRAVNALALSQDGQHLYAGTEGMGVFRLDFNEQAPPAVEAPVFKAEASSTPQPPPTNPSTEIISTSQPSFPITPVPDEKSKGRYPCTSGIPPVLVGLAAIFFSVRRKKG